MSDASLKINQVRPRSQNASLAKCMNDAGETQSAAAAPHRPSFHFEYTFLLFNAKRSNRYVTMRESFPFQFFLTKGDLSAGHNGDLIPWNAIQIIKARRRTKSNV